MKKYSIAYRLFLMVVVFIFPLVSQAQSGIQKVTAHIFTRQAEKGYVSSIQGDLYYSANGNLVSNFTSPKAYIMITNNKGEVQIYNRKDNTVTQFQNTLFSTNITPFYYFFSGKTGNMGLSHAGYKEVETKFDKKLVITLWKIANANGSKDPVVFVRLVHKGVRPIYMDYEDAHHKIIRKAYYYNYTNLNGVDFPRAFTEILYQDKDSVITKTEYSNFKINGQAKSPLFEFKVPEDAKLVKQ